MFSTKNQPKRRYQSTAFSRTLLCFCFSSSSSESDLELSSSSQARNGQDYQNYKHDCYWYARKALVLNTLLRLVNLLIVLPFALPTFLLRGRFVLNAFKAQSYRFQTEQDIPYNFQPGQAMPNKKTSKRSYHTLKVLDYDVELRVFLLINCLVLLFDLAAVDSDADSHTRLLFDSVQVLLLFLNLFLALFD